ncbi:LacI family DNA-binding transcriptional regulator [Deinococcus cellulosilyticus]|uniref:LacI family transcriptional regulator n=1 Tax=Deinococcus cellulosilyticus (strain DSM 18568 / NBRC 106333 / KACC 11606 / 5516J-15) TaxID=1223518 RepID=A0A511MV30_DEIC1|nr:LacI family DNA-binding transcriptional regulator [Deinococcus cellulosilyticus]GEM44444.1 LacI family transcriptional regulator [Deinococcus cellulosilyticus NBRC 106333 = KACC 11606]
MTGKSRTSSPTIRDIARHAGVSLGTTSRALNNQLGINDELKARVLKAAEELGYDFSNLRQSKTIKRITFIYDRQHNTLSNNPFYSTVLHGVEDACNAEKISLTFASTNPEESITERLKRDDSDALLCVGAFEPEQLQEIRELGIPVALIDLWHPEMNNVNSDNFGGAYLLTGFLIERGYKRIAFICGPESHYSITQRRQGYRYALLTHHIEQDPDLEVFREPIMQEVEGTDNAVKRLLKLKKRPDAIFCWNDATAIQAIQSCVEAGLNVPEDIAIVGFDDLPTARTSFPPLTTVKINKEALGRRGVELLLQRPAEPTQVIVPTQLVIRGSTL